MIDEITFRQQLENWRQIPYSAHTNALSILPADVLAFPSLLFQLMAHALMHQPVIDGTCSSLESLKSVSEMTFMDLACGFSDAGFSTLELVGQREVTVVAIQSGILRASLLRNIGNVIETRLSIFFSRIPPTAQTRSKIVQISDGLFSQLVPPRIMCKRRRLLNVALQPAHHPCRSSSGIQSIGISYEWLHRLVPH